MIGPRGPELTQLLSGFEQAYALTFWASLAALGVSLLLPGWPGALPVPGRAAEGAPALAVEARSEHLAH